MNSLLLLVLLICVVGSTVIYYTAILRALRRFGYSEYAAKAENAFYYFGALMRYRRLCRDRGKTCAPMVVMVLLQITAASIAIYLYHG